MDAQDIMEFAGKASYAFAIIAGIIVTALIWYKITGHSPTALDLVMALQVATIGIVAGLGYKFAEFKGKMEEWTRGHEQKFAALATDFKASQIDFRKMQSDTAEIKQILTKKKQD